MAPSHAAVQLPPDEPRTHDLRWIRPPRQARTHQSLERLLDEAEAMLQEKDFDAIHISELATRADSSVASFYRRFKDKVALLHALHERHCEEAYATAEDALREDRWEGATIADILHTVFPFLVEILHSNERLDRAILQRVVTDDDMRDRQTQLNRHVVEGLTELLLARREEIHHADPATAIRFATIQALATLFYHHTVGTDALSNRPISDEFLAQELASSFLAYLGVESAELRP